MVLVVDPPAMKSCSTMALAVLTAAKAAAVPTSMVPMLAVVSSAGVPLSALASLMKPTIFEGYCACSGAIGANEKDGAGVIGKAADDAVRELGNG